ncbi:UDP-glycosyltransferase 92A1-like [Actinidia eriantha]|uniref:UDP-glycosyltransferase 92A1-like n=1 Tax=Actinidia eriantha TaxID=165200 RepID=UPI00258D0BD8|nr:UDP-glycosyltransferase 92A1-like [Actinidia eriantha]
MAERKENIVMFPFMAQGHIIPFLALALELEKKGYTITFVNTPQNIKKIQPFISPTSAIHLLEIPFDPSAHGLPPNIETTESFPPLIMIRFIVTSPALQPAFRELISRLVHLRQPPLCIISDMFFGWSAKVAHEFGAFHAIFNAGGGYGMATFHSLWLNIPHMKEKSEEFSIPGFPKGHRIHIKQLPDHFHYAVAGDPWCLFSQEMFQDWKESDGILFNTIEEIDHVGLDYFREQIGCPVWPIGPILSSLGSKARAGEEAQSTLDHCMKWLDSKPENSVLYVAFGSQSAPSPSQTIELAMALEASGKNFIWVIRPPINSATNTDDRCGDWWLPCGFEQRIHGRGLLLQCWAPQLEILSHKSIGAFLSHCGWNSVLEALSNGVPMLAWPMMAEQHFNAKMLEEEIGVCIGVGIGSHEVKSGDIMETFEVVMGETSKGKDMKNKVCEIGHMLGEAKKDEKKWKGASTKAMDDFLSAVLSKSYNLALERQMN